jgi:hypothetical protein
MITLLNRSDQPTNPNVHKNYALLQVCLDTPAFTLISEPFPGDADIERAKRSFVPWSPKRGLEESLAKAIPTFFMTAPTTSAGLSRRSAV